jgi:hypothetical protein
MQGASRGGDVVYITVACIPLLLPIRKLTSLTANPFPRQRPRETVFPDRNLSATLPRLHRQMAPIPIPRSRIRL